MSSYLRRLARTAKRAADEGKFRRGRAYILPAFHESWCPRLAGTGECCCDVEFDDPIPLAKWGHA